MEGPLFVAKTEREPIEIPRGFPTQKALVGADQQRPELTADGSASTLRRIPGR